MGYSLLSDINGNTLRTKDMHLTPSANKQLEMGKDKIKQILREDFEVMPETGPKKLSVFDFDGTTMDTLYPEIAKPMYKEKTGQDWPFQGWWGRKESLDMDIFDFQPKPDVKRDYQAERANSDTMVVSLTGRRPKLSNEVEAILHANGYRFDRYMYNYGSDTLSNKLEQIGKMLQEFPSIKHVELWDDRNKHIPTFEQWGNDLVKNGRLDSFNMNHVINEQWTK
jgi:hypothetical protein